METPPPHLVRFLASVRIITLRRAGARSGAWILAGTVTLFVVLAVITAWTLRGDILWLFFKCGVAALTLAGLVVWIQQARLLGTYRGVANCALPDPPSQLREEIVAAADFLDTEQRSELADLYLERLDRTIARGAPYPTRYSAPWRLQVPTLVLAVAAVGGLIMLRHAPMELGYSLLATATDGRPPVEPAPIWSSLTLELVFPRHTGRPPQILANPSGVLRVPAGTKVSAQVTPHTHSVALTGVLVTDAIDGSAATEIEFTDQGIIRHGEFTVRGSGSWQVVSGEQQAPAFPIEIEEDRSPEIELLPLSKDEANAAETDVVDLRFRARDDFGLVSAELVFELPAGEEQPEDTRVVRLPIDPPPPGARTWNHHYAWKLASLSVEDRVELTYWVEVRDNDPGLGTSPLEDPPGKVTRSAAMQLRIEDAESRHEDNLVALREIRDAAVDLLATRLTSPALAPSATADELSPLDRLFEMHSVLGASASLLGQLNLAIDALSVDTLSPERDVAVLTAIHERLLKLHREETLLHEDVRVLPGGEQHPGLVPALRAIARHNPKEVTGLEDEIIRLDDLVDTQIIEQIEGLVARLQTSQQRLVELLEALKAGDESVRAELELLHQRVLEDLRRVAQARSMLSKEVGSEFLNTDAFEAMQDQVQHQDVMEQLRRGEIDKALESARSALSEIQQLRDDVQGKLAEAPQASLSPEEQARLEVLRELSRIQDAQSGIRAESRKLHQQQRDALTELEVDSKRAQELKKRAKNILERYDHVRDARLGRRARTSFEDSRQALKHLVGELEKPDPGLLSSAEQADTAARAAASAAKHGQ
ncbi:MAG: hypothetical protein ACPG4T_14110, partial [Nannocystaceae bacterium]